MHAPGYRIAVVAIIATSTVMFGCRGARPFGRVVQVRQETDANLPEVEAPQQRLATAKPRTPAGLMSRLLGWRQEKTSPDVSVTVSKPAANEATPHVAASSRRMAGSSDGQGITDNRASDEPRTRLALDVLGQDEDQRSIDDRNAEPETDSLSAEDLEVIAATPPQYRPLIKRQLEATQKQAQRAENEMGAEIPVTGFPNSVDRPLADAVEQEHDLAVDKTRPEGESPTQIAKASSDVATSVRMSDNANAVAQTAPSGTPTTQEAGDDVSGDHDATEHRLSDLVTTEVEPAVVQTISDHSDDDVAVQPASASRRGGADTMVTQAAMDPVSSSHRDQPADASGLSSLSDQQLYELLLERFSTVGPGESEADRSSRVLKQRLVHVLAGHPDAAVDAFEGMPENEQAFFRNQLLGLWTMIDPSGHPVPSRRFNAALPQIREAAKFAAAATDTLEVRSLAFCTEIQSYGQIKPFEGNRFNAGQQVILYCEIENFNAKKVDQGYETHLQGSYDIYNQDGEKVVSQLLPADRQVSANYLRDYFIAYQMHLPQELDPGTYRLQLTMEDIAGKKYGQSSIPFEIQPQ